MLDKKYLKISFYVIVTSLIIMISNRLIGNIPEIFKKISYDISWMIQVLKPVVIGFVIAYLMEPFVSFLEKRIEKIKHLRKKARLLGVFCSLFIVIFTLFLIMSLLFSSITNQMQIANIGDIPLIIKNLMANFNTFYSDLLEKLNTFHIESEQISSLIRTISSNVFITLSGFMNKLLLSVSNISGSLSTFAFGVFIGIYFMIDGKLIRRFLNRIGAAFLKPKLNNWIHIILNDLDTVFSGYLKGQLTDVMFMAVAVSITLLITGVKLAIVIGVLTGLANLIPFLGGFVAYGLTALVCIVNGDYKVMLISIIALFFVQMVDGNIVGPRLLGNSIHIHPVLVIIFIVIGNAIGGLLGMLLAVPVGSFIKLEFMKLLDYLEYKKDISKKENDTAKK